MSGAPDLCLRLNVYRVEDGVVMEDLGLAGFDVPDGNGDGTISDKELADALNVPRGHILGNETSFFKGVVGTPTHPDKSGYFYTAENYAVGDDITETLKGLNQNFDNLQPICICFTAGTLIATDRGEVPVEMLVPGDLVRTRDAGLQPVRWIGRRELSAGELERAPSLRPIRIRAGALGAGTPSADLVVSPQHRVLVRSKIAVRMFGAEEVLVAAKQLLQLDGIDIAEDMADVTYVHFLCDDHQVVFSNGAETESLYTGPEALKAVGPAALAEIFVLFPELRDRDPAALPQPARILASGRMGRRLAVRHADKGRPLVS